MLAEQMEKGECCPEQRGTRHSGKWTDVLLEQGQGVPLCSQNSLEASDSIPPPGFSSFLSADIPHRRAALQTTPSLPSSPSCRQAP